MTSKYRFLALAMCLIASPIAAETDDAQWTLTASGSWSEISSSDRDAISGSISLSRRAGEGSIGAAITTSNGADALFDSTEITDRSSWYASAWIAWPIGDADVDLSVSYGQDDYDGRLDPLDVRFGDLNGDAANLVSEVDSFALTAALSRTLVAGDWDFIPNASLGWSQSEATSTARIGDEGLALGALREQQSGVVGTIGMGFGYVASENVYLYSDILGLYAENGASTGATQIPRLGGLRASSRQVPEEVTWVEVSFGASLFLTDVLTLSLGGGTTAGRDDEEVFALTSLSVGF